MQERQLLRDMFDAAIAAASPDKAMPAESSSAARGAHGRRRRRQGRRVDGPRGRGSLAGGKPLAGLVVTRYGHGVGPLKRIEVVEAAHPVPDAAGQNGRAADSRSRRGPRPRRPRALPDLGRRLGPAVAAGARDHARRQAGAQQGAAHERRQYR